MAEDESRPRVGVGVVFVRRGKVFLARRRGALGGGSWGSAGGHLEFGETLEECARREAMEEFGVEVGELRYLCVSNIIAYGRHYLDVEFLGDIGDQEPRLMEPDAFEGCGWYPLESLPVPLFQAMRYAIDSALTGQQYYSGEGDPPQLRLTNRYRIASKPWKHLENQESMMAAKKGDGLLLVYSDVAPENDEEYNRWYNDEHIPERLSIPGVLSAARYEAVQGGPKYLAVYELASHEAWHSEGWQKWLREPTEWSKRMSPSVIGTEYIRNLYRRVHPKDVPAETAEADMSPVLLVGRMTVPDELDEKFNEAYNNERLPLCLSIPGYIRARRWEAVMGSPRYVTVHEMESLEVSESEGWNNWRTAVTPIWTNEVRPHMVHENGSPGVYRRIFPE